MRSIDDRENLPPAVPLAVGQTMELERFFSQADFDRFARLSGDDNPIHVDPTFAARTRFGRTVAHGMLLYSVVETELSRFAPALTSYSQTLKFPHPTYAAEAARIHLEVTARDSVSGQTTIATKVFRPDGAAGLEGDAVLGPASLPRAGVPGESGELPVDPVVMPRSMDIGKRADLRRSFNLADLAEYAGLIHGLHTSAGMLTAAIPGSLLGSLFSCLLGTRLPGQGTNYLKQRLEFHRPAYPMQELTASVEVIRVRPDKQLVNLLTLCINAAGEQICSGEALVLVSDVTMDLNS